MKQSDFIMYQILAFLLSYNLWRASIILLFFVVGIFLKRNLDKNYKNIIYGISLLALNVIFDIDLHFFNFVYLGVFSFVIYIGKIRFIKKEIFLNGYLFFTVLKGVLVLWQSF